MFACRCVLRPTLVLILAAASANAQQGPELRRSGASLEDSLAVLHSLRGRVASAGNDSAAWHQVGILAWALSDHAKQVGSTRELSATSMYHLADTALRTAAAISARDVGYHLDVGRFLMTSTTPGVRSSARAALDEAAALARAGGTPAQRGMAALAAGRAHWLRYDAMANRYVFTGISAPRSMTDAANPMAKIAGPLQEFMNLQAAADLLAQGAITGPDGVRYGGNGPMTLDFLIRKIPPAVIDQAIDNSGRPGDNATAILPKATFLDVRTLLEGSTQKLADDITGESDFLQASAYYDEAYSAAPLLPGAFRALAMAYAERSMWFALDAVARSQIRLSAHDSIAWLALGLAAHRLQHDADARAAFDSALRFLGRGEAERLDTWKRVLPTKVPESFFAGTDAARAARERMYWMLATPFWADTSSQTRVEFLARVAFAELRWSDEETGVRGADTDRGDIFVRYGPPEKIMALAPSATDLATEVTTFWFYKTGLIFAFSSVPPFGTAHIAFGDAALVDAIEDAAPVRWDNTATRRIDSLQVQVARFRAGRDSIDVWMGASILAPDSIRQSMSVRGDVKRYFWLLAPGSLTQAGDASVVDTAGIYTWSARLASSSLIFRVEELGETSTRGARATGAIDGGTSAFPLTGFGISDILIGRDAAVNDSRTARWNDVLMTPVTGAVAPGSHVTFLWENYDLAARDGAAEYEATITLQRDRSIGGRIVAQLVGPLATIARASQPSHDRVSFTFSRSIPHTTAFADQMTVALGETPEGGYTVTLVLKDNVSGRVATRETHMIITR